MLSGPPPPPEEPAVGAVDLVPEPLERRTVEISGWALSRAAPVSRVEISVGGAVLRADLGVPRDDVARAHAVPEAPLSGWRALVAVPAVLPGTDAELALSVEAVLLDGTRVALGTHVFGVVAPQSPVQSQPLLSRTGTSRVQALVSSARVRAGRPRLLVITHSLGRAGAELQLEALVAHLSAQRWTVVVVAPTDGPGRAVLESSGAAVHVLGGYEVGREDAYAARLERVAQLAGAARADVALVNTLAAFPGADVAVQLGLPVLWDVHETMSLPDFVVAGFPFDAPVAAPVLARAQRALRDVDLVVVEAAASAEVLREGRGAGPIAVIPPGVRPLTLRRDRRLAREVLDVPADQTLLLCLGALHSRKAQGLVVRALPHLAAPLTGPVQLVLVGHSGGPYGDAVKEEVRRHGLSARVRFVPQTTDVGDWLSAADLLVLPSQNETLPGVVLEAMSAGLPVVATRVGAIPEVVVEDVTGWVAEPNDLASLVLALRRALATGVERRRAIVDQARERVSQLPSRERRLADLTDRLLRLARR